MSTMAALRKWNSGARISARDGPWGNGRAAWSSPHPILFPDKHDRNALNALNTRSTAQIRPLKHPPMPVYLPRYQSYSSS